MPELPEVEVVVLNLRDWLVGRIVRKVAVQDRSLLQGLTPATWSGALKNRRCVAVERRAKYVLIHFDNERTVVGHLAMTGKIVRADDDEDLGHSRLQLRLDDGSRLSFKDRRRLFIFFVM